MIEKEFISPNNLVRDSFVLAKDIFDSGYRPDVVLVLWRGGTPVGIVVHEFLLYKGIKTYHTAVKAESYTGIEKRIEPKVEHLDPVLGDIKPESKVLVVDDIFDTGSTLKRVMELLAPRVREVRSATLYYKTGKNLTDIEPDYFLRKTENWIVFPHELLDLSPEEIRRKDPYVGDLV